MTGFFLYLVLDPCQYLSVGTVTDYSVRMCKQEPMCSLTEVRLVLRLELTLFVVNRLPSWDSSLSQCDVWELKLPRCEKRAILSASVNRCLEHCIFLFSLSIETPISESSNSFVWIQHRSRQNCDQLYKSLKDLEREINLKFIFRKRAPEQHI